MSEKKYEYGVIASAFDIIHPGYIYMFQEAKQHCEHLIVFLHENPNVEREEKRIPLLSVSDRRLILESIRYVDSIFVYRTEEEFEYILSKTHDHVRFLGDDYIGKDYTGDKKTPVIYLSRNHGWSATKFIKMIIERGQ